MKCLCCNGEGNYSEGLGIPYGDCGYCKGKGRIGFGKSLWWWFIGTRFFSRLYHFFPGVD